MNHYEEKQNRKLEAYKRLSKKNRKESEEAYQRGKQISDAIPFGQPILVGHHSERRHRKDLERIRNSHKKSFELENKAKYYDKKAENIQNPRAISSDDPEAVKKLKQKITDLEREREETKKIKKIPRDFSFSKEDMRSVHLSSLSSEIRRCKKRIEELQVVESVQEVEETKNDITISVDKTDNRLRIFFPSIPDQSTRSFLKSHGFRWSPFNKAWQRMISDQAFYYAKKVQEGDF